MTHNPFLNRNELKPIASINRLKIIDLPKAIKDDEVLNKSAYKIFSKKELINEIKKYREQLNIDISLNENEYPLYLNNCLDCSNEELRNTAYKIITKYGRRLGYIFLTLKMGEVINQSGRVDWDNEHWEYWHNLKTVILVGGLSNGRFGELFITSIMNVFEEATIPCYDIRHFNHSSIAALLGCARNIKEAGVHVVMDLGQSYIKRAIVTSNNVELTEVKVLKPIPSLFMKYEYTINSDENNEAMELHNYILDVIINTIKEVDAMNVNLGCELVISIANYIVEGRLYGRGGYGKLGILSDNYDLFLGDCLSKTLNKSYMVKMIHDGTAASHTFNEVSHSACVSLGTAFGIGFPNHQNLPKKVSQRLEVRVNN